MLYFKKGSYRLQPYPTLSLQTGRLLKDVSAAQSEPTSSPCQAQYEINAIHSPPSTKCACGTKRPHVISMPST
eukprot:1144287-Pelagomonas_calceolata.AAC.4